MFLLFWDPMVNSLLIYEFLEKLSDSKFLLNFVQKEFSVSFLFSPVGEIKDSHLSKIKHWNLNFSINMQFFRLWSLSEKFTEDILMEQIVLLNEHTESRTTKLALPLSEPCIDMEIISSSSDPNKPKQDSFLLLGKSGHFYAFDDSQIERYLLQYQSRSPPSAPKEVMLKMPFLDSSITAMKLITGNSFILSSADEV